MKPSLNPNAPAFPAHGSQEELSAWAQRFSRRTSSGSFTTDSRNSDDVPFANNAPIAERLPEDPFGMTNSPTSPSFAEEIHPGLRRLKIQPRGLGSSDGRISSSNPIPVPSSPDSQPPINSYSSLDRIPSFCRPSPTIAPGSWGSLARTKNPDLDLVLEAAQTGELGLLAELADGAAPLLRDDRGRPAIYLVCEKKHGGRVIDALIQRGANIETTDPEGNTALMLAVKHQKLIGAATLLLRNANPDTQDTEGRSAWHVARDAGNLRLADTLRRFGATSGASGTTIRTRLLSAMTDRNLDEVLKFASMFEGKEAVTPDGRTALHLAAAEGDLAIMRALLAAGLKPNVVDRLGNTPLHHAAASGSKEACLLLERFGAFKELKNASGLTPGDL